MVVMAVVVLMVVLMVVMLVVMIMEVVMMVVTHTSGETRQKRAGDEERLGMWVRSDIWKL